MSVFRAFIFLTLLVGMSASAQPGGSIAEGLSQNRKFSAGISTASQKPLLSVFDHSGGTSVHLWSHPLTDKDADDPGFRQWTPGFDRLFVSDDGGIVVLRTESRPDFPPIRVISRGGADKDFGGEDLQEIFDDGSGEQFDPNGNGELLEVLLESEKPRLFALWHPRSTEWAVADLEKLTLSKATAAQRARLDQAGLAYARERVRRYQPSPLKQMIDGALQRAAAVLPSLAHPNAAAGPENLPEAAYRFLAFKKQPQDKGAIERLLEGDFQESMWFGGSGPFRSCGQASVTLRSPERLLGDELLTLWETQATGADRPKEEVDDVRRPVPSETGSTRYGEISGKVALPFAMPLGAGPIFVYLIPVAVPSGAWPTDESVIKLAFREGRMSFPMPSPNSKAPRISVVNFDFGTLTPGEYRLKAVWDRRPPFAPETANAKGVPEAGDYESSESAPLKLAAGKEVRDVVLLCTNQVGSAESMFAEDAAWAKKHPAVLPEDAMDELALAKSRALVHAPIRQWVLKTNENAGKIELRRIQLNETEFRNGRRTRAFSLSAMLPKTARRRDNEPMLQFKGELVDEHGCSFEGHGYIQSGRTLQLAFSVVPLGARRIVLRIDREDQVDEKGRYFNNGPRYTRMAEFTLTNLFEGKPEQWQADTLPAKKKLDLVSVELTGFDPRASEFSRPTHSIMYPGGNPGFTYNPQRQNKFSFSNGGQAAPGWKKLSGAYFDRWGNESQNIDQFCKMEEVFRYQVQFARDPQKGSFLPQEKLEVPLLKVPAAGESVPLDIQTNIQGASFQLFSVGGTGEFTYENGELTASTKEIDDDAAFPQFGPPGGGVQPKLFVKPSRNGPPFGMPWMMRGGAFEKLTIASKIPHLVCRLPAARNETLVAILEQDTSVPEPISALRNAPGMPHFGPYDDRAPSIQYLALDYRPGEIDKKITVIAQKPRKVEFIVHVSKEQRAAGPE